MEVVEGILWDVSPEVSTAPRPIKVGVELVERGEAVMKTLTSDGPLKSIIDILEKLFSIADEVAKIHPLANMAWLVVRSLSKISKNQIDRDAKVVGLIVSMSDLYSSIRSIKDIRKDPKLQDVITSVLQNTVECALFVQEYIGEGFDKRTMAQLIFNTDGKIKEFKDVFNRLKKIIPRWVPCSYHVSYVAHVGSSRHNLSRTPTQSG